MSYLITGGAGFIGGNFMHYMVNKYPNDLFVCIDALTYAGNLETLETIKNKPNFKFVHANICDRDLVYKLFHEYKFDYVVNFAAESHVDRSIENPTIFLETNIIGTSVLMDACRKYGIKRYHQVSTDEVYGDLHLDKPESLIHYVKDRPGHDLRYAMDPTKLITELGWKPKYTFETGIKETIKWNLDNQDWINHIISGEYLRFMEKNYNNK